MRNTTMNEVNALISAVLETLDELRESTSECSIDPKKKTQAQIVEMMRAKNYSTMSRSRYCKIVKNEISFDVDDLQAIARVHGVSLVEVLHEYRTDCAAFLYILAMEEESCNYPAMFAAVRKSMKVTQAKMAKILGVPVTAISKIEHGSRRIDFWLLVLFCLTFDAEILSVLDRR